MWRFVKNVARRLTSLVNGDDAGDKGKEVADDENSKKPFKSDLPRKDPPPYRNDNNDDDGNDDGAPPSIGVSITQVDTTSTIEDFAIVAFENQTTRNVEEGPTTSAHVVKLDVRTSYGDVERDDMGINHGFTIRYLKSRI